jgi:hypothetical protein
MSNMKPVISKQSRPLRLDPWALRHQGGLTDSTRFMTAMATDGANRSEESGTERRVEIEPTHYRSTGARYRVTYLGETLIESARDPEFEACRALLAKGVTGTMVTYSPGSSVPSLRVDIEKGAELATVDNAYDGPRFRRYRPHPDGGKADDAE